MHQRSGALLRRQIRDRHLLAAAQIALQACAHFRQRKVTAQVFAQPAEAQSRRVQTRLAIRAVVKAVVHIFQQCGFEFGIVHAATIARTSCGALVDKSYSSSARRLLHEATLDKRVDQFLERSEFFLELKRIAVGVLTRNHFD